MFAGIISSAQSYEVVKKGNAWFIECRIDQKTNLDSVAKDWNIEIQSLKKANPGIPETSDLENKTLLLPLFSLLRKERRDGFEAAGYRVRKGETLFGISKQFANYSVEELKMANGLRSNNISPGQKLTIGFIELPEKWIIAKNAAHPKEDVTDSISVDEPVAKTYIAEPAEPAEPPVTLTYKGVGYFEKEWRNADISNRIEGKTAVFKSESGWEDGRFYVLHNTIEPGTIVKLSAISDLSFIYAKVLGPLPDIRQNKGLITRVNSAAAAMLGFYDEEPFDIIISY